jgi:hypothetical protein
VSEDLGNPQAASTEDEVNTTPPNPSSGWKMPDPVFRKTSGYLPQGFEKKFPQEQAAKGADVDFSTASIAEPESPIPVEPQPDISEQVDFGATAGTETVAAKPKKGSAGRIVLIIFGILVALAIILIFFAVVYYLFIMPEPITAF